MNLLGPERVVDFDPRLRSADIFLLTVEPNIK